MFTVGTEYVVGSYDTDLGGFIPLNHNSKNSEGHPCRGICLKVGKKYAYMESTGKTPWKVSIDASQRLTGDDWIALPVDAAKALYKRSLIAKRAWRTDEFIADCVERL